MSEIRERIQEITKKIGDIKVVESELSRVQLNMEQIQSSLDITLSALEKLHTEIESMQKFSVGGIIKSVFIDKKATLELKRDHYYKLSKKYDALKSEKAATEYEMNILKRKMNDLATLNSELQLLMVRRENELLDNKSDKGLALENVLSEIKNEKLFQNKCNNLVENSENLLQNLTLLSATLQDLESSLNWNKNRHRRTFSNRAVIITRAKEYLKNIQFQINPYIRDLRNIGIILDDLSMPTIRFDNEFGMFFDNIISDFVLKRDLMNGIQNTERLFQNIKRIKNEILSKITISEEKIIQLTSVKEKIIME